MMLRSYEVFEFKLHGQTVCRVRFVTESYYPISKIDKVCALPLDCDLYRICEEMRQYIIQLEADR